MTYEEVEPRRARVMRTLLVRRDWDYPFFEDLITDEAGVCGPVASRSGLGCRHCLRFCGSVVAISGCNSCVRRFP